MNKDEIIKALRNMARYPTVTMPRDSEALKVAADLLAQPEQEPVAFPSRRAVERAIESVENPKGMHLNDGKERVILPGGTLRYMLALIDHTSPPQRQTEQEPVAWHTEDHLTDRSATTYSKDMADKWEAKGWPVTPLYASPPQREWVGLTDDEMHEAWKNGTEHKTCHKSITEAIESKLKEKNT